MRKLLTDRGLQTIEFAIPNVILIAKPTRPKTQVRHAERGVCDRIGCDPGNRIGRACQCGAVDLQDGTRATKSLMDSASSNIADLEYPLVEEFILGIEIPFIGRWCTGIRIEHLLGQIGGAARLSRSV